MESAIPAHLRCPRTRSARASEAYVPPSPAWVARFRPDVEQVVMAYLGVQSQEPAETPSASSALEALGRITAHFASPQGPKHHDLAHYVDEAGFNTYIAIAYWDTPQAFTAWQLESGFEAWWQSDQRLNEGVGYFREVISPHTSHFETMFSSPDRFEGLGRLGDTVSGEIQEHAYWGSMRDRLPASQCDAFELSGAPATEGAGPRPGARVHVRSHDNVALIRSGQDWGETAGKERELYLSQMEPILREGMDFLRDKGLGIGCYFNRYMTHVDLQGQPQQKSFGLSYWRSLEHMERWAESHPTHVAIFGTFLRLLEQLNSQGQLRLYHEVTVAREHQQSFEYLNCHPRTGLLRGLAGTAP